MTTTNAVEYALLHPDGRLEFAEAPSRDLLMSSIRAHIPDVSNQGMGTLRAWFADSFGMLEPNPLADVVLAGVVGYHHPAGWRGPVALTMEEQRDGSVSSLGPSVRRLIEDLASAR